MLYIGDSMTPVTGIIIPLLYDGDVPDNGVGIDGQHLLSANKKLYEKFGGIWSVVADLDLPAGTNVGDRILFDGAGWTAGQFLTAEVTDKYKANVYLQGNGVAPGVPILSIHTHYWDGADWVSTANVGVGENSLYDSNAPNMAGVGHYTLYQATGSRASSVGNQSGYQNSGIFSTFMGYKSGYQNVFNYVATIGANAVATKDGRIVLGDTNVTEIYTPNGIYAGQGFNITGQGIITDNSGAQLLLLYSSGIGLDVTAESDGRVKFNSSGNQIKLATEGTVRVISSSNGFFAVSTESGETGNPSLLSEVSSSTNPVFSFLGDSNTGVGRAGADQGSLIAGATEIQRFEAAANTSFKPFYQPGTFAELYVHDNTTAQSIASGTTYTKSTAFSINGSYSNCTPDATNSKITATKTGFYKVSGSVSFSAGTVNTNIFGSVFYNNNEQNNIHFKRKISTAGDVGSASFLGIIDVTTANTDIDLRLRHDDVAAVDVTIEYGNLTINYLGET